ncbi:hypothetical protein OSTOST_14831, partial [Ostertagia ostertagi]
MRLADRNKWKDFNKTVEELEVVKARALKEEKKRQRDLERARERRELEERGFSSVPVGSREATTGKTEGSKEGLTQLSKEKSVAKTEEASKFSSV